MTSEVWQRVGPLSPCGRPSYPSNGLPGSADVHKHAQTIRSLSRWFLSLAEERKVKLACIRMMAGVPEDCLFFVCCHGPRTCPGCLWQGLIPPHLYSYRKNDQNDHLPVLPALGCCVPFPRDNESQVPLNVCSFCFHQFLHQELRPSSSGLNCSLPRFIFEVSAH